MTTILPHYVIAIGASAGGMEEINTFFDHTPLDGVAYVIVQHLSPVFKSRMVELLAKHSKLVVKEADNAMTVQANEVYLIPNDKFMTIRHDKLYLSDKTHIDGPHLTINTFFKSLAINSGTKAIGVVLSGLGSDGTEGIIAIKNAGGMIIARNPATAEFSSMPSNAIATGMVDYILEPQLMPAAIEDFVESEEVVQGDKEKEIEQVKAITNLIKEQSPLDFTDYKQATILRRIKRRAGYNNYDNLKDYFNFLNTSPIEVDTLARDFLISVTNFFRDAKAFEKISKIIIPAILKSLQPDEEIKVWVAGCATGEEAYSIGILFREQLVGKYAKTVVKIFATDIDTIALEFAGKGIYTQNSLKNISPERLQENFRKEGDGYKINSKVREMMIFAQHDLVKNPPYCNMHFVSCRNLLIYMTPALQKKIFLMLLFGLRMDGFLFLGSSENPLSIISHLEVIDKKWKLYKNIERKRLVHFDGFSLPQMVKIKDNTATNIEGRPLKPNSDSLAEIVNKELTSELGNLAVCIDDQNHVIKTFGDTTKYLLQKNFNLNLVELLPKPLAVVFNTISITAKKTNEKVSVAGVKIKYIDAIISVTLAVTPVNAKNDRQNLLIVTFREDKVAGKEADASAFDEKKYHDNYTLLLEDELVDLKDKLHNTYEQLDASNDNMQSYNEELLSANEEMQSTNEEMQSVNEELHTINADYQLKNKELSELNDDLNNYFRSNIHGQLFVNNDLLLMKFSPGTVNLINLLPTDIGRPLSNISTNIKFETLAGDIIQVLKDGTIITKEIETNNGLWYQVVTMPYLQQANNKRTGAILTFNDVTELKKTQIELDKKNKSLIRINEDLDNFVHTASHDLLAPLGNIELSIAVMNEVKVVEPELKKFLTIINTSVKKFRSLVTEISTIAKIESDMIAMEMVNLESLIKNIEWSLEDRIKDSNATIVLHLGVPNILFSRKNLRSILYNLISNGIKFKGKEPPIITVTTSKKGNHVMLSVKDNGIGMTTKDSEKIFGMYNRLNQSVEGQGIGLYLVKKIVDAASGELTVTSEEGKGSEFTINFNAEL